MKRFLRILGLPVAGCACPRLDAVPIRDPEALAAPEQAEDIRAALEDFLAWTGGTGVCIPAVELTSDQQLEGALGRWDGEGRPLLVEGGHSRAYGTMVHELCHAWDEGAGDESDWHADLFRPGEVTDIEVYDTRQLRVRESFARACEDGPLDLRLRDDWAERCGLETRDPGERWIRDEVYSVRRDAARIDDLAPERHSLDAMLGGLRVLDAVAGRGRIWLLAMRGRPFHPLQPPRVYHVVLAIDPTDGAVVGRAMLRRSPDVRSRFRLVGGEAGALLVEDTESGIFLSTLDGEARPGPPLRLPPETVRWDGAAVVDGHLWMTGVDEVAPDGLTVLDLQTGELEPAPLDPPLPLWRSVFGQVSWTPDGTVLVGGFTERLGVGVLRIDPDSGRWEPVALPDGAEPGRVGGLPDGRVAYPNALWSGDTRVRVLAASGADGELWVSQGCEQDRVAGGVRFLPLPDALWMFEDASGEDGVDHGRWLTRVGRGPGSGPGSVQMLEIGDVAEGRSDR